jgi:ribonuclease-3
VAEQALLKSPAASRKPKPRAAQLKLAGIATIQSDDAQAPAVPAIAAHTKQNRH